MGKKSKAIKSPEERYLVVQHPWGMRKPSTERGKGCVNNLDGWFRIMLRDLVDEDHCSIVVYMVRTVSLGSSLNRQNSEQHYY